MYILCISRARARTHIVFNPNKNTKSHAFRFLTFKNSNTLLHMLIFIYFVLLLLNFYDLSMGCCHELTVLRERVIKNQPNINQRLCHCVYACVCLYGFELNGIKFKINIQHDENHRPRCSTIYSIESG